MSACNKNQKSISMIYKEPSISGRYLSVFYVLLCEGNSRSTDHFRMASYRAYFGGKVPGADDAFAGSEDVVPTCAEESQLV